MKFTRKKGGKYIAQGSYGCVFGNPPLKCKNENTRRNNTHVSKLQNTSSTENEFLESKEWHAIDPENEFSLTPIKRCDYDNSNIQTTNHMEKCTARMEVGKKQLLLYKHGGTDLIEFKVKASNYAYLFNSFYDLFNGLAIAHKNNIIHSDIKPENILAKSNNTNIHLRFIDFGMSYKLNNETKVNKLINTAYYKALYFYWPFEIKFIINSVLEDEKFVMQSYDNYISMIVQKLRFIVPRSAIINKNTNNLYTYNEIKELYKNLNLKEHLTKLDVYSMGVTICQLASYYFKQYMSVNPEYKDIIKVLLPNGYSIYLEDIDSNHLEKEFIEWHKTIAEHVTRPLYTLMLKLLDFNPEKRLTAEEAAEEYKKLLPSFSKYLGDKKKIEKIYEKYPDFLDKTPSIQNPPTPSIVNHVEKHGIKRKMTNRNNRNSKKIKMNK
jgi:serine/threonine protein kinase